MTALNSLAVTEADLKGQLEAAQAYLENTRQRVELRATATMGTHVRGSTTSDEVSIRRIVESISTDDPLLSDTQLHTLRAIRRGLQMGFHLAEQYRQRSGAASFETAHGLADAQKAELNEKMQTAAAVLVFSTARFILWDMRLLVENNSFLGNIPSEFGQVDISTPRSAAMAMMYYLGKHLQQETNGSDDRLVAAVYGFAQVAQEAVLNRVPGLKHSELFTGVAYMLENTDFSIAGFEAGSFSGANSVEFNRVDMGEIVGNADAKHFARRLALRLLAYNFIEQRNVFSELGGLPLTWMGYGKPGTGKSMMIAALATIIKDHCDHLNIPFLFHPLPDNLIDSYQGKSAQNMMSWFGPIQDPTKLIFAPIDDAENNFEDRDRKAVSEGVKAVIGVFLRYTEGAYSVNRGNATIGLFTNLADIIDPAVRSRIQGRMVIDGADSVEDYIDQNWLMLQGFADQAGFFDLEQPKVYERMSAQRLLKSLGDAAQTRDAPAQPRARDVFEFALRDNDPRSEDFFGTLFMRFMEVFPTFSSRDVRNVHSAVKQRIMDFDLPTEWFDTPDVFCQQPYDRQKAMVLELRDQNLGGLSLSEILRQEAVRYLDNYELIAGRTFKRQVDEEVERRRVLLAVQTAMQDSK